MADSVLAGAAESMGRLLSHATAGVAALRTSEKPLHPTGLLFGATLVRTGTPGPDRTGVPWLDESASEQVLVRLSRAIGLPSPLPDIAGVALRAPGAPGRSTSPVDVLFASTGWDRLSRHLLLPSLTAHQPMTTLLPYRTRLGPVVLGARPDPAALFHLSWARVGGPWRSFGTIVLDEELPDDPHLEFDPVLNPPEGLEQYRWVSRLREGAYATARRTRRRR